MIEFGGMEFTGNETPVAKDCYFIIDMVGLNPSNPDALQARFVVSNATAKDMEKIRSGEKSIPNPMIGAKQRVTLQVISVRDLDIRKMPKG